ncbi:MAG: hypothetical protein H6686_12170 [Fibrobacteria bacterium]|nr:hypothetical protein [Fibrobacteria bacterium]
MGSIQDRLQEIDRRLEQIPLGSIEIHSRGGDRVAFRVSKLGPHTRFARIGPQGGPEHLEAVALLEERRALSRERKELVARLLEPSKPRGF